MKRVGIVYHPKVEIAYTLAKEIQEFLTSGGISVWLCSAWDEDKARSQIAGTDLILSIGGDGTILQAVRVVAPSLIPITGINLGRLGFLNELSSDEAVAKLPALLSGEGWIDERAMLEAELSPIGEGSPQVFYALNDVVVARGAVARAIYIETSIDGQSLTTYKGDGIIVATATGSTGYSLSAGGPILHPQAKEFLLLPILPHLTLAYPLVLPPTAEVKLRPTTTHQAMLSIDGRLNLLLSDGAIVTVKLSSNTIRFLRIHPRASFYSFLEQRLKGKQ